MSRSSLPVGEPLLGWLDAGIPGTDKVAVMLENTGTQIVLTVPTEGVFGRHDPYSRWFTHRALGQVSGSQESYQGGVPDKLDYFDHEGRVTLLGCRARGVKQNARAGAGRITAEYAVLNTGELDHSTVHGVRVELPALIPWTGIRSLQTREHEDANGDCTSVSMKTDGPTEISFDGGEFSFTLKSGFETMEDWHLDSFQARGHLDLVVHSSVDRPIEQHMEPIAAVRDLLAISAWAPVGFVGIRVWRDDDPQIVRGRRAGGFAAVETHRWPKREADVRAPQYMIRYDQIGAEGVNEWIDLHHRYKRGIYRMVAIADGKVRGRDAAVLDCAIALEAIAYTLAREESADLETRKKRRKAKNYEPLIELILHDMRYKPVDTDWIEAFNSVYKGVKHADNAAPHSKEADEALLRAILVFRCWVAHRLGVPWRSIEASATAWKARWRI